MAHYCNFCQVTHSSASCYHPSNKNSQGFHKLTLKNVDMIVEKQIATIEFPVVFHAPEQKS